MAGARPGSASQTTGREGTLVGHESPGQVKLATAAIGSGRRMGEVAARMGEAQVVGEATRLKTRGAEAVARLKMRGVVGGT
jgi:hypothetical protein